MARALSVSLGERSYRIVIGDRSAWQADPLPELVERGREGLLVTDANVARAWLPDVREALEARGLRLSVLTVPAGERSKGPDALATVYDALLAAPIRRDGWVVALGGGVVGDLAGFAAATYLRGIAWIQVPTSLLAMADSSVGGKTGIDVGGKNTVGAFHQPRLVLTDPGFLVTLPDAELSNGLAEVVKAGMIADPVLFDLVESRAAAVLGRDPAVLEELLARAVQVKIAIVEEDERESGKRQLLNLGHTFGHAIEAALDYRGIRHGEAVAIGLVAACRLSTLLGLAPSELVGRIEAVLGSCGLPIRGPGIGWEGLRPRLEQDKKAREQGWSFVLTGGVGNASVHRRVPEAAVREAAAYAEA
jgi:3-dehydroquinate synthase